jgi:tRNA modification GTPase
MYPQGDTIAAISTPAGSGGVAVLRVSGPAAIPIVDKLFSGRVPLKELESQRVTLGNIIEPESLDNQNHSKRLKNNILDDVLAVVFRSPRSYTAEDTVEISCHGGRFLSARLLELILLQGARLAQPGEFTLRAYLNGRMDLSQAEAVADLIRARTDLSLRAALAHVQGRFSERINALREGLIDTYSLLELELDFAEEDVEFADREKIDSQLRELIADIADLLATYNRGKILRDGAKLVIVGKPNVGKSSLLNALLQEDRAIVTEVPGTTRDSLEEQLDIGGVPFRVVDTAGLRETDDVVEREGVKRTLEQIESADLILFLFDGSEELGEEDGRLVQRVLAQRDETAISKNGILAAINKVDLERKLERQSVTDQIGERPVLEISAKELAGLEELRQALVQSSVGDATALNTEPLVTNIRHKIALERAEESLRLARRSIQSGLSSEFVVLDIRAGLDSLGELIGVVTTEDILGNIFSNFCIGK